MSLDRDKDSMYTGSIIYPQPCKPGWKWSCKTVIPRVNLLRSSSVCSQDELDELDHSINMRRQSVHMIDSLFIIGSRIWTVYLTSGACGSNAACDSFLPFAPVPDILSSVRHIFISNRIDPHSVDSGQWALGRGVAQTGIFARQPYSLPCF